VYIRFENDLQSIGIIASLIIIIVTQSYAFLDEISPLILSPSYVASPDGSVPLILTFLS
jgi:hypothetical protein